MPRKFTARAGILTAALLAPPAVLACRCVEPAIPDKAYRGANAIVVAKAVEVTSNPAIGGLTARLAVSRVFKSSVAADITVVTGTDCYFQFEAGKEYLLFLLRDRNGSYSTRRCLGNRPLEKAAPWIKWLKERGKPPRPL